jgi:hypothetical protein
VRVVAHQRLGGKIYEFDAVQLVVYDRFGNPLVVSLDHGIPPAESHHISKVGDHDFDHTLQHVGITRTVVCQSYSTPGPPSGSILVAGPGK